jgi:hypothetical protein
MVDSPEEISRPAVVCCHYYPARESSLDYATQYDSMGDY